MSLSFLSHHTPAERGEGSLGFASLLVSGFALLFAIGAHAQVSPPATVSVDPSAATNQVTLSWPAVSGATGYNVRRANSITGSTTTLASSTTAQTFTDTSVTSGTRYYYAITALNGATESIPLGPSLHRGGQGRASDGLVCLKHTPARTFPSSSQAAASSLDLPCRPLAFSDFLRQTVLSRGASYE